MKRTMAASLAALLVAGSVVAGATVASATEPDPADPAPTDPATSQSYVIALWEASYQLQPFFPQALVQHITTTNPDLDALDSFQTKCHTTYQVDIYADDAKTADLIASGVLRGGDESFPTGNGPWFEVVTTADCPEPVDLPTEALVTPAAVTQADVCGPAGSYTIPTSEGVTYSIGGTAVTPGTYQVNGATQLTVVASADAPKYGLEANVQTEWPLTFTSAACPTVPTESLPTPTEPTQPTQPTTALPTLSLPTLSLPEPAEVAPSPTARELPTLALTASTDAPFLAIGGLSLLFLGISFTLLRRRPTV